MRRQQLTRIQCGNLAAKLKILSRNENALRVQTAFGDVRFREESGHRPNLGSAISWCQLRMRLPLQPLVQPSNDHLVVVSP
jgi:hypothetical protein